MKRSDLFAGLQFLVISGKRNSQDKLRLQPRGLIDASGLATLEPEKERPELLFAPFPMTKPDAMPSIGRAGDGGWLVWSDVDHRLRFRQEAWVEKLDAWALESGTPGRRQIFIRLDRATPAHHVEALNRALCEKLDGDQSKVSRAAIMRLPAGFNTKGGKRRSPRLVRESERVWSAPELASALGTELPDTDTHSRSVAVSETPTTIRNGDARYGRVRHLIRTANQRFAAGRYESRHGLVYWLGTSCIEAGVEDPSELLWVMEQCDAAVSKASDEGKSVSHHVGLILGKAGTSTPAQSESAGVRDEPGLTSADDADDGPVKFRRLDWAASFVKDFSEVDWLPGRFVERGQQVSLVADGKVGKSLFILNWCMALALEWRFLGHTTGEAYRVLYFDRENSERDIITRARSLGLKAEHLAALGQRFDYRQFPQFDGTLDNPAAEAARQFLAIVDETKPDVVIIDTASRFIGGKEDSSDTWLQLYQLIHEPLKARGIACIRLDHFGKDEGRGSRGSSAKSQDVDHVWEMTRKSTAEVGSSVVTTLAMKRTHTRTGYGDDLLSIIRVGVKNAWGLWEDGGTSHKLQTQEDVNQAVVNEGLNRPDRIVEILRRSGPLSTTELVTTHFPELTKRTVQRDLTELADQARVKNVGRSNAPSWVAL
ncbi:MULTISPECIES: AAA family ATPase [unclassified Streptomyces]|uniref:AAA family ATPase n=1 Tax=unclassified Streptomyces TaxID=2593676 RepID=UPI0036EB2BA6